MEILQKYLTCALVTCGLRLATKKGIALLMMLIMISSLMGVIMLCSFVLSHEANKDERHQITRQRMLEVKRALIGRLADVSGGEDITSCGGFINDYGRPYDNLGEFDITELLSKQSPPWNSSPAEDWVYDGTYLFWAGYRGERYLKVPPAQPKPNEQFLDGWGFAIKVEFIQDENSNHTVLRVKSIGNDNVWDESSGDQKYYGKDIKDSFYWKRKVEVTAEIITRDPVFFNKAVKVKAQLVYPEKGNVSLPKESTSTVNISDPDGDGIYQGTGDFNFGVLEFPVGARKIVFILNAHIGPYAAGKIGTWQN